MKEYKVLIREELQEVITIKAKSAKEAKEIVTDLYNNEQIVLSENNLYDYSIETLL